MRNRREMLRAGAAAVLLAGSAVPVRAADDPAVALVESLIATFQEALKQPDVRGRASVLADPVARSFDLPAMLRLAIGTRWTAIPADKQAALTEAFGPYLTATYANRLAAAAGSTFAVQPRSEARGPGRLVQSTVTDRSGDPSPVDYVIGPDGRITDVFLQGTVSEAGTLRTGFSEPLKEGGPDALLAHLRKSTETMLAASPSKP